MKTIKATPLFQLGHNRCDNRCVKPGVGTNQCHCTVCHKSFTAVGNFDDHRRHGQCLNPADLGMTPNSHGFYRRPMTDDEKQRFEKTNA